MVGTWQGRRQYDASLPSRSCAICGNTDGHAHWCARLKIEHLDFPPEPQVPDAPTKAECGICEGVCIYEVHPDAEGKAQPRITTNAKERKGLPLVTGVLDYFPDALLAVAEVSRIGNDQHNPGQPLHWSRDKSTDHADCIGRHLLERGTRDTDGGRHSAKAAWRILALLQLEIEAERLAPLKGLRSDD